MQGAEMKTEELEKVSLSSAIGYLEMSRGGWRWVPIIMLSFSLKHQAGISQLHGAWNDGIPIAHLHHLWLQEFSNKKLFNNY